jgi:hypothetical protein
MAPAVKKITLNLVPGYPQMLSVNMWSEEKEAFSSILKAYAAQLAST